jgi:phosphatidylglycerol lysyltransferase
MNDLQSPAAATADGDDAPKLPTIRQRLRPFMLPTIGIAICIIILLLLERATAGLDYHAVIRSLIHLPAHAIGLALLATALSYVGIVGRDWLALRQVGARVRPMSLIVGSIAGTALGNAIGFGALTGGAVRYRVYGADGVGVAAVTRITVIVAATFGLGLVAFGSLGTLLAAPPMAALSGLPERGLQAIGFAGVALTLAAVVLSGRNGWSLHWRSLRIDLPGRAFMLGQLGFIAIDVLGAGLALWVLLPTSDVSFGTYLAVYSAALLLGVIGHTPGGLGVFEATLLFILGTAVHPNQAVAALLAYRAVYFFAPVLVSAALLAAFEARGVLPRLEAAGRRAAPHLVRITPMLLGPVFVTIVGFSLGVMLVFSGATPAFGYRLAVLETIIPLWMLESANLLGSILGVFMLFTARGLWRRLDGAWWLAVVLTLASLVLALAKGLAFFEISVLGTFLLLLLATRPSFNRPASLFDLEASPAWLAVIAAVLLFAGWLYMFAFRTVPYSNDLLWDFAFDEKAPRALRATLGSRSRGRCAHHPRPGTQRCDARHDG